jgi:hypothetical protein
MSSNFKIYYQSPKLYEKLHKNKFMNNYKVVNPFLDLGIEYNIENMFFGIERIYKKNMSKI